MLGVRMHLSAAYRSWVPIAFPAGVNWDRVHFDIGIEQFCRAYRAAVELRDLVDPGIWTGAVIHVDGAAGDDANSGLCGQDDDFADAKRAFQAAFNAGNATGGAYRALVKPNTYAKAAFNHHVSDMPNPPLAVIGWAGPLRYRAVLSIVTWRDARMKARWAGVSQRSSDTGVAVYRVKRSLGGAICAATENTYPRLPTCTL
ncbi:MULTISPECIES: hypothetical protein [unclassified Sulfitobacter]|uniref:hypothetical protein n=1 Tax=unclassified Sulfitobacter TaxID=196795 RepID=UPI003745D166